MRHRAHQTWGDADGVEDPLTGERVPWKPIGDVQERDRAAVSGAVSWTRVDDWAGGSVLDVGLSDGTGAIQLCFLGRRHIDGIGPGVHLAAVGTVGVRHGRLVILNPDHRLGPARLLVRSNGHDGSARSEHGGGLRHQTLGVQGNG
jgi:hypothetical protein